VIMDKATSPIKVEAIPEELRALPQWVVWRRVERNGKVTKVPFRSDGGGSGSTTDPSTWSTFDAALAASGQFDGIGFVFSATDYFVGIDLDHVIGADGVLAPWAGKLLARFDSYSERSPSGTGLHVYVRGVLPVSGRRKKFADGSGIEMYAASRFFTVTGDAWTTSRTTVEERAVQLAEVYALLFPPNDQKPSTSAPNISAANLDDEAILERAKRSKDGPAFAALMRGDTSAYQNDHSAADMALCGRLAFWLAGDAARIDRVFRGSGLMRAKWNEKHYGDGTTYGAHTIAEAIAGCREMYELRQEEAGALDADSRQLAVERIVWEDETPWPQLHEAALYGLPGEIVRAITPHTEADPAALLTTLLTMAGNMIGAGPYVTVGAARHEAVLFTCIVGASAKARKGQSFAEVRRIAKQADTDLVEASDVSGLSTGEGLVTHFQDRDDGPVEKRALIHEAEFARTLSVAGRENSTLSEVIRQLFDRLTLRVKTRKDPLEAKGAFGSFVGHITLEELHARLADVQIANGFANRFTFVCAKRGPLLPDGGNLQFTEVVRLGAKLRAALDLARTRLEMKRSPEFAQAWRWLYKRFPDEPGLAGTIVARAEVHTLRLALIYALLDGAVTVNVEHLIAGYAFWAYCEDSARHIFGRKLGDDVRQRLIDEIRARYPSGLDRTAQHELFQRHVPEARIKDAREWMVAHKLALEVREVGKGAPRQVLYATRPRPARRTTTTPATEILLSLISLNSHTRREQEDVGQRLNSLNSLNSHPPQENTGEESVLKRACEISEVNIEDAIESSSALSPGSEISELSEISPARVADANSGLFGQRDPKRKAL
jgi:hypothetical protein